MNDKTESYKLVTLTNGIISLCSEENNETFHPGIGPEAEAEILYVGQLKMAERMASCSEEFIVWDVGLGAAANAIGALKATQHISGSLRLVSFDCTEGALRFAVENAEELGYVKDYEEIINRLLADRSITFQNNNTTVTWEFHLADFPALLQEHLQQKGTGKIPTLPAPHAIMFDAYSPVTNPAMWTQSLFTSLFSFLSPDRPCSMSTYSRSTMLRVSLLRAGFFVGSGESTGMKAETTVASNSLDLLSRPLQIKWLDRVRCSTCAEPLQESIHRKLPITPETLKLLLAHPQWTSI